METAIQEKKKELVDKYSHKLQDLNAKGILPPSFNHVRVTNMMRIEMARTRSEDLLRRVKKNSKRMKTASAQQSSPSKQSQNIQDDFVTKMNTIFDASVNSSTPILSSPEKPSTGVQDSSNFTTPTKRPSTNGVSKITPTKLIPKISFNWLEESFAPIHWTQFLDDFSIEESDSDNFRAKCTRICEIVDKLIVVLSKETNRNENMNEIVQVLQDLLIGSLRTLKIISEKSNETWIRGAESLFASLIEGQSFSLLEQESIHQLAKYFVNNFFSVQSDIVLLYNRKRDEFSDELYKPVLEQLKRNDFSCLTDTLFIRWRRAIAKVLVPKISLFSEWNPLFEVEQNVKRGRIVQLRNLLLKNISILNLYNKDESDEKFRIIQKFRILYIIVMYVGLAEKSFGEFFCNILQIEKVKYVSQLMDITLRAMNISPSILPKHHALNNDPFWNVKFFEKKKENITNSMPTLSKSIEFSSTMNLQDRKMSNSQQLLDKQLSSLLLTKDQKLKDYKREIKERTIEGSRMGSFKTQIVSQQQQNLAASISRQSSLRQSVITKQSNEWGDWKDEEDQLDAEKMNVEIEKDLRQLSKKYLSLSEVKNHHHQQQQQELESAAPTRQVKTKEGILNEIECKELFYRLEDIWTKLKNNYNINLEYYNFYLTFVGNITLMKDAHILWKSIAAIIERREHLMQKWKRLEQGLANSKLNSKSKALLVAFDEQRRYSLKKQMQYLGRLVEQAASILKRVFKGDIRYCNELYLDRVQQEDATIVA